MTTNTYKNNVIEERSDTKRTLYVNAIGKKSNEIIEEIMKNHPWWRNPRIIKTNYGPFMARKYSWVLSTADFYDLKKFIHDRVIFGHKDETHYLVEDKKNVFIFDRIEF